MACKPLHVPNSLPLSLKTSCPFSPKRASPTLGQLPLSCCWQKPWPGGREEKQESQACYCISNLDRAVFKGLLVPPSIKRAMDLFIFLGNLYRDREVAGTCGFGQPGLDSMAHAVVLVGVGWGRKAESQSQGGRDMGQLQAPAQNCSPERACPSLDVS